MDRLLALTLRVGGTVKQGTTGSHVRIGDVRVYPRSDDKWTVCHKASKLVLTTGELIVWLS